MPSNNRLQPLAPRSMFVVKSMAEGLSWARASSIPASAMAMAAAAASSGFHVRKLKTKYPQGAGEMLIKTLVGREVPPDSRSYQIGAYVQNVVTLDQMGALLPQGRGFIERVITVVGTAACRRAGNTAELAARIRSALFEEAVLATCVTAQEAAARLGVARVAATVRFVAPAGDQFRFAVVVDIR